MTMSVLALQKKRQLQSLMISVVMSRLTTVKSRINRRLDKAMQSSKKISMASCTDNDFAYEAPQNNGRRLRAHNKRKPMQAQCKPSQPEIDGNSL